MTSAETKSFAGRRIVVAGGGRGIGRAIVLNLSKFGADLHVVAQSGSAAAIVAEITAAGGMATAHTGSIEDEGFCQSVVDKVAAAGGAVDGLVNAAGILGPHGRFAELSMAEFAKALNVNLMGTCNFIRACLPIMESTGFGRIVNFAGGGAAYAYPNFTPYGVSKAAVVRLTETIAEEITVPGVTINVIAPGAVATDMLAEVRRRGGEVRTVTDIAEPVKLVRFLLSRESGHITGRFIHVRDNYLDPGLFTAKDMLKLRRIEKR